MMNPYEIITDLQNELRQAYAERDIAEYNLKVHIEFIRTIMKRNKNNFVQQEFEKLVNAMLDPRTLVSTKVLLKENVPCNK